MDDKYVAFAKTHSSVSRNYNKSKMEAAGTEITSNDDDEETDSNYI